MKLLLIVYFFSVTVLSAEIEFEHSFSEGGGSQWGTEDSFNSELDLPESQIPVVFKGLPKNKPQRIEALIGGEKHKMLVNRSWEVCIDPHLGLQASVLDQFLKAKARILTGDFSSSSPELQTKVLEKDASSVGDNECDVLLIQGKWSEFPYQPFQGLLKTSGKKEQIFSIYYRFSEESRSVIVVHPDYRLTLGAELKPYIQFESNLMDGEVLLSHELGHWLGFWHVDPLADSMGPAADVSVMGVASKVRNPLMIERRYFQTQKLSRFWERRQLNIFRSLFWFGRQPRHQNDFCLVAGEKEVFPGSFFDSEYFLDGGGLTFRPLGFYGHFSQLFFPFGKELSGGFFRAVVSLNQADSALNVDSIHMESTGREFYPVFQLSMPIVVNPQTVFVTAGVVFKDQADFFKSRKYILRSKPQDCY